MSVPVRYRIYVDWKTEDEEILRAVAEAVSNLPPPTTTNDWQNRVKGNDLVIPISTLWVTRAGYVARLRVGFTAMNMTLLTAYDP